MEFNLGENLKQIIIALLLFILPMIILIVSMITGFPLETVQNTEGGIPVGLYYVLLIIWIGMGIIFFSAINLPKKSF